MCRRQEAIRRDDRSMATRRAHAPPASKTGLGIVRAHALPESCSEAHRTQRDIDLHGQSQRGDQIVMGPDPKRPVAIVGVGVHADLVAQQLFGEHFGLASLRQMQAPGLEQRLEAADEIGLPQLDLVAFRDAPVPWVK